MNRETCELLIFVGMFLAASYLLMRGFRAYLDAIFTRAPGESWGDVWKRARAEHVLNRNAQLEMFGSKWATVAGRLIVVGIVIALVWFLVAMPAVRRTNRIWVPNKRRSWNSVCSQIVSTPIMD